VSFVTFGAFGKNILQTCHLFFIQFASKEMKIINSLNGLENKGK